MNRSEVTAFVALGANLGDATAAIHAAIQSLKGLADVSTVRCSSLYLTDPIDSTGPDYVNAVVEITTLLTAPALLSHLQAIEDQAGRERPYQNAPRLLDLDLLLYGQATISSTRLQVPHPRMYERAFVLVPLAEISPELVSATQLSQVSHQKITRLSS